MKRFALILAAAVGAGPALAQELEFSAAAGPALNIARQLMSAERGELLRDDETVSIALVDLDGDGRRDIFAFADASYFCGSAGCIPRLYRLADGSARWQEVPIETEATINGEPVNWSVGEADQSGWKTLGFDNGVVRLGFAWTGAAYSNR